MAGDLAKKKSNNIYDSVITMDNLYDIWLIIKKTCKNKKELYYFELNLNENIYSIYKKLKNKTYIPSKFKCFMIFEPKPRLVMSQTIEDKIVNHFIAKYYLLPYIENSLIDSNVATRKNKGSSYAMKLLKKYINKLLINNKNKEIYCLKIDVSKYFYSINHEILIDMVSKKIKDKDIINLIKIIIKETNSTYVNKIIKYYNNKYNIDIPLYINNKGLSIGAMSSQFLAIFYLNDIDHYIKEILKCKYYIRYMDDILILDTDKEKIKYLFKDITKRINDINLKVNKKSNIYRCSTGFSFLGYKYVVINNKLLISCIKSTYKRIISRLNYLKRKDLLMYRKSYGSYIGYFNPVIKKEMVKIDMNSKKLYEIYKDKYNNYLIIVKEGIFYKSYYNDAKIIWYLFKYKLSDNIISFGNNSYDKVINKLRDLNISFVIVSKEKELLNFADDESFYISYKDLSCKSYKKFEDEEKIIKKLKNILSINSNNYKIVNEFLEKLNK